MRSNLFEIGSIIRGVALAVPTTALWTPACTTVYSSCDGFYPQRAETRITLPAPDAAHADAGLPSTKEECLAICAENGATSGVDDTCRVERTDGGGAVVVCSFKTVCEGRRPSGYEPPSDDTGAPLVGRYFAAMAATEAASVAAFERMAEELDEHGLPPDLVVHARRAADDEARHFRMAAALARRFGARAVAGRVAPQPKRTLFDMAVENAREGVVRETVGAILGHFQARHAGERVVRKAMTRIARDETSHSVLSWAVHATVRARLSPSERRALDEARADALLEMERDAALAVSTELTERVGVPRPAVTRALLTEARRRLFDRADAWH